MEIFRRKHDNEYELVKSWKVRDAAQLLEIARRIGVSKKILNKIKRYVYYKEGWCITYQPQHREELRLYFEPGILYHCWKVKTNKRTKTKFIDVDHPKGVVFADVMKRIHKIKKAFQANWYLVYERSD